MHGLIRKPPDPNLSWFKQARLGMFVHFGPYAMLARGEQIQRNAGIPRMQYENMAAGFNPLKFKADDWVDAAELLGARYITITAKHLDGFCMFDSRLTDYKITNTPFGRDLIGELAEACHRRGIRICFYYSRADWHHRQFVNDPRVRYSLKEPLPDQTPDWPGYLAYFEEQLKELCTNYGKVSGIWFDAYGPDLPGDPPPPQIYRMIKKLQPEAAINDRNGYGDFYTPERDLPGDLSGCLYECCQALGMEWGYVRDCPLFSLEYLIRSIAHCVGHGGNFLLNIGPKADGTLPPDRLRLLRQAGQWVKANAASIYGTDFFPLESQRGQIRLGKYYATELYAARRGKTVHVFLPAWPALSRFLITNYSALPARVELRGSRAKLSARIMEGGLAIDGLPAVPPQTGCNVVVLTYSRVPPPPLHKPVTVPAIRLRAGQSAALRPGAAVVSGRSRKGNLIRVVDEYADEARFAARESYKVFENWTRPEQAAAWKIHCAKAGNYKVQVVIRCDPSRAGSVYRVQAAGREVQGTVKSSPLIADARQFPVVIGRVPSPLTRFRFYRQTLGVLRLPQGRINLKLQPVRIAGIDGIDRAFAEIKEVRLASARH